MPETESFPLVHLVGNLRTLATAAPFSRMAGHLKTLMEAVSSLPAAAQPVVDDVNEIVDLIGRLFGTSATPTATAQPTMAPESVTWRQRRLIDHVRRAAQQEYAANGLATVQTDLARVGLLGGMVGDRNHARGRFDAAWKDGVGQGAEQFVREELAAIDGHAELVAFAPGAIGDGKIWAWIQRAGQWLYDHREQILAIALKLLQLLVFLGLL